jgi:hypothetical protein
VKIIIDIIDCLFGIKILNRLHRHLQNLRYLLQHLLLYPFVLFQAGNFLLALVVAEFQGKGFLLDAQHIAEAFDVATLVNPACGPVCVGHDIDGLKVKGCVKIAVLRLRRQGKITSEIDIFCLCYPLPDWFRPAAGAIFILQPKFYGL